MLVWFFLDYFVIQNRLGLEDDACGNNVWNCTRIGVLVAATGRFKPPQFGAAAFYLRYFLFFADYASAKKAEKMAGDAQ
jgi:hypothetical protein